MLNDLRYALRTLLKSPGFTTVAVLTLALGIGANTAIFQLIDAVALRPLPVPDPHSLAEVRIAGGNRGFGISQGRYAQLTRPVWHELGKNQQALDGMFAWGIRELRVGERSHLRPAEGIAVSGEYFSTLGVKPHRGRLIQPADESAACPATVAVVSYAFWQQRMGGRELDSPIRIRVNLDLVDVVGVAPPGFFGVAVGESFDIALALCQPKELRREVFDIAVMGRLRPGWTSERASVHFEAISAGIFDAMAPTGYSAQSIARFKSFRLAAYPAATGVSALRTRYEDALQFLFAMTALILLIACANLANLLLARASARDREVAVRVAIGASRMALIRQFAAESLVLAAAGAVVAIFVARGLGHVLLYAIATGSSAPDLTLSTDWRVLAFAIVVASVTCVMFGIAPAIRAIRIDAVAAMKSGGRGATAGHERLLVQRLMVATQIAMAVVMLVAALLFVGSFRNLMSVDTGMRHEGITAAGVRFPQSVAPERFDDFRRELLAEITSVPGIVNAGTTSHTPLLGGSWSHGIRVGAVQESAQFTWVSPGYFDAMGIALIRGRDFNLRDTRTSPRVAIVNETFVKRFAGAADPIGQTLRTGEEPMYPSTLYEIVGVIPDTQYNDLRGERRPMVFGPDSQHPAPGPGAAIMIHSSVPPDVAIGRVREHIARRYPDAIAEFSVFATRIRDGLVRERLLAMLAGFFGVLAVALTVVGLYGMLSYLVAQRRPEIGVRVALGARRMDVLGLVMGEAGKLVLVGVAAGLGLSLLAGRSVASLLFGIEPNDPLLLASACALLGMIAIIASFLPARRAARVDPAQLLREG
jgi:predicted permease